MKTSDVPIHILTGKYAVIDPWFGRSRDCGIELDMGCGKGGYSLALAELYPQRLVLASDVMIGRLRRLANKRKVAGVENLEVLRAANLDLVAFMLPPVCVKRVHLLCPDPWPKARHRPKRLVSGEFLGRIVRILEPGGIFHFASDEEPYVEAVRRLLNAMSDFFTEAQDAISDVCEIRTEFETRWLAQGKHVHHIAYRCLGYAENRVCLNP